LLTIRVNELLIGAGPAPLFLTASTEENTNQFARVKKGATFMRHRRFRLAAMRKGSKWPPRLVGRRWGLECVPMKSRETLIRLKRFQVEEKRRRVRQIELMMAEFTRMTVDLDREIAIEEKRAGIADPSHFAYPTYARAAMTRRDNLKSSVAELSGQLEEAKTAQEEAQAELLKFETLEGREKAAERTVEVAARV
jgi:flagellar protein FliJ